MILDIQPLAERDILSTHDYLLEHASQEVALRFMNAAALGMREAMRNPAIGTPTPFSMPDSRVMRSWPVPAFPSIRIYFVHDESALCVVRVLHGKRDVAAIFDEDYVE